MVFFSNFELRRFRSTCFVCVASKFFPQLFFSFFPNSPTFFWVWELRAGSAFLGFGVRVLAGGV